MRVTGIAAVLALFIVLILALILDPVLVVRIEETDREVPLVPCQDMIIETTVEARQLPETDMFLNTRTRLTLPIKSKET